MKTMRLNQLKKQYEFAVSEYVKKFCNKQKIEFDGWVGDKIGGIACFSEQYFFNFNDIVWDINSKQPNGLIFQWQNESVENNEKSINYFSYSKGLRYSDLTDKK